jgi:serine protease Do
VAKEVVRQILKTGKVTRSTIGLTLQPLQDLEAFFDVGKTEGAVVSSVEPDGPAAKADIQPQDVLLEFGGEKVKGRYPEQLFDLRRRVAKTRVGEKVKVKLKRAGEVRTVEIVTEELTTVRSKEENFPKWGLVGQDITDRLAQREKLPSTKGVYVTGVRRGEPAERAGVKKADVIVRIGDKDVSGAKDLKREYNAAAKKKQAMVLLRVRRGQGVLPVLLRLDYDDDEKNPDKKAPEKKPAARKKPEATK